MSGGLTKLKIISYTDSSMDTELKDGTFVVQINPQGYGFKHKVEYDKKQGTGTSAKDLKFNKIAPQELELEFLFDATGAIPEDLAPEYTKAFPVKWETSDLDAEAKSLVIDTLELAYARMQAVRI